MNLKTLKKQIEGIGESLNWDEDWMPCLLVEGNKKFSIVGLEMPDDQAGKDRIAQAMTAAIEAFTPDSVCFISTAWTISEDIDKIKRDKVMQAYVDGRIALKDHPDRVEIVGVYCYAERGENEGETLMMGFIERSPGKYPRIKKWEMLPVDETKTSGRFPDAIRKGFESIKRRQK